jgi:hypothetical protein
VKSQNFELEQFYTSKSISLTFHGFDFVIGPFQDASATEDYGLGQFNQPADAGSRGPVHPILQDSGGGLGAS